MSILSWFTRKSAPVPARNMEPSGLLNPEATIPLVPGLYGRQMPEPAAPEHAANRKNERMERRELLYTVVRDAMVRAGVLSASYKFKVLSLDQRGRQFLVMMDLAREYGGETVRLSEIEALIAQTAKTRYDILVTAVYWRINDHVAVGIPQKGVTPQGAALPLQAASTAVRRPPVAATAPAPLTPSPSPLAGARPPVAAPTPAPVAPAPLASAAAPLAARRPLGAVSAPAPLVSAPAPLAAARQPSSARFEPIEADEVAAFKRALANAAGSSAATAAAAKPGVPVRSGPLLPRSQPTGFEDTEMPDADSPAPDLSSTQYGELN